MGAFVDLDDFVNRMTGGNSGAPENLFFHKMASTGGVLNATNGNNQLLSAWRWDGIPNAGAVAAAVAACDKTTVGALQFTNSGGSLAKRLVQGVQLNGDIPSSGGFTCWVVDRLLAVGGLSGTTTTAQTVGGSIGRYTGGEGNQIWVEIQTAIGSTATTITASYTNQAGTASRTTIARKFGGNGLDEAHCAMQLPLQAGDTGVRSVQSVTVLSTTSTAGDFAVVVYHPLTVLLGPATPVGPFGSIGVVPEIVDDACITFLLGQNSTKLPIAGMLCMVDV